MITILKIINICMAFCNTADEKQHRSESLLYTSVKTQAEPGAADKKAQQERILWLSSLSERCRKKRELPSVAAVGSFHWKEHAMTL